VTTFCYNISRGLPISINNPATVLRLAYVDDVIEKFIQIIDNPLDCSSPAEIEPVYEIALGELAAQIERFRDSRSDLMTGRVGVGFLRALHATYVSYLDPANFSYPLTPHTDQRGTFVEMLRTPDSGQFSFFTANPGFTRGGHYHHSKTEKFLVIQGSARFGFRHILTNEIFEIITSGAEPRVVETVPGWSHDITNIGHDTMIVMLWANEVFDRDRPDTITAKVFSI
jgi:UDP-2-acetamido-2,6-beta-L-arabino-hexul-4-ose reductase